MSKKDLFPVTKNNHAEFYQDGDLYIAKYISMINEAKKSIHLQTYIFETDCFGQQVKEALIAAARRGVVVYLLVDSVGSRNLSLETEKELKEAGIHFCRFNSIEFKWFYRWGRRLHHKVLMVDLESAMIGGINVLYSCLPDSIIPQLDFAVFLQGPALENLALYCQQIFRKASQKNYPIDKPSHLRHHLKGHDVGISVNDWIHGRSKITKQYSRITMEAKHSITIINSYFFPRRKFMKQITDARKRGVRVRLILPRYSDWPSYILASEYLYDYFLKRGIEIYQWRRSILHGKLATVDQSWSTIGSFNLNYTSYQQNLEMNVDIYSHEFTQALNEQIENLIELGCDQVSLSDLHEKSPLTIRIKRFFFYLLLSLIANFSIGLSFQEDHNKEHRFFHLLRILGSIFFFFLGIIGSILPIIPGFPFFIISFLLVYKQILLNKKAI